MVWLKNLLIGWSGLETKLTIASLTPNINSYRILRSFVVVSVVIGKHKRENLGGNIVRGSNHSLHATLLASAFANAKITYLDPPFWSASDNKNILRFEIAMSPIMPMQNFKAPQKLSSDHSGILLDQLRSNVNLQIAPLNIFHHEENRVIALKPSVKMYKEEE